MHTQFSTRPASGATRPLPILNPPSFAPATTEPLIRARCEKCNDAERGTKSELQTGGWFIGLREDFCPRCNSFA